MRSERGDEKAWLGGRKGTRGVLKLDFADPPAIRAGAQPKGRREGRVWSRNTGARRGSELSGAGGALLQNSPRPQDLAERAVARPHATAHSPQLMEICEAERGAMKIESEIVNALTVRQMFTGW